ncbi:MAG: hypothetical protein Q8O87_02425 [bacterium]|nr:hypothetical protein [bacterium]
MTQTELLKKIAGAISDNDSMQEALDDLVIDAKLAEASDVNNTGWEGQCMYLFDAGYDVKEILNGLYITED